jgi:hypothetical protein
VENSILNALEVKIDEILALLGELQRQNKNLKEEKKKLLSLLAEKTSIIDGLQVSLEKIKQKPDDSEIIRYQENEKKLKNKIKFLLSKLDELDKLE